MGSDHALNHGKFDCDGGGNLIAVSHHRPATEQATDRRRICAFQRPTDEPPQPPGAADAEHGRKEESRTQAAQGRENKMAQIASELADATPERLAQAGRDHAKGEGDSIRRISDWPLAGYSPAIIRAI